MSKYGTLRSGTKSDLVGCLEDLITRPDCSTASPNIGVMILDGAAIVHMLPLGLSKTFDDYSKQVFIPYKEAQLQKVDRVDIVWDVYIQHRIKTGARQRRGRG